MNFAVSLIFLMKPLFLHDQKLKNKQKLKYPEKEESF